MTSKRKMFVITGLACLSVFLKNLLFQWFCYKSLLVSSLFSSPSTFINFYLGKLVPALIIAGCVCLFKRKRWSAIVLFIIDLWMIANLVYYRANGMLLDIPAILMASNLKGFESSIASYFKYSYLILPLISLFYTIALIKFNTKSKSLKLSCILICIVLVYNLSLMIPEYKGFLENKEGVSFDIQSGREEVIDIYGRTGLRVFVPFHTVALYAKPGFSVCSTYQDYYTTQNSILHYFVGMIVYHANLPKKVEKIDNKEIMSLFSASENECKPKRNLVMILVESLESWPFENQEIAELIAPNLYKLLHQEHTVYFSKMTSMAKHGVSGDGQMALVSGLLPISSGSACILYGDNNDWPGIPQVYESSLIIDPAGGAWNQHTMTKKYGFRSTIGTNADSLMHDEDVFEHLCNSIDTISTTYCILLITEATHSPFAKIKNPQLEKQLPDGMPTYMKNYLICLNYTDAQIGKFLDKIYSNENYDNTDIVVTGDHNVFKPAMLAEFYKWPGAKDIGIQKETTFCPFFIYSHSINNNSRYDDTVYQMDLFPTIMNLIGCSDYYWKGFGVNLLDAESRRNRHLDAETALNMSDQMIRGNYFASSNHL